MSFSVILSQLTPEHQDILKAVKKHAYSLLDHSPRFKFFTLHGEEHLDSLFRIFSILLEGGIELDEREIFLLSLAICTHDLGMVVALRDCDFEDISEGRPGFVDPVGFENFIRETHHDRIIDYINGNLQFLTNLGLNAAELSMVVEIGKAHRKIDLDSLHSTEKRLGSLMRVIDELDIGPNRAPMNVFENLADEMDGISCWHWYKHSITSDWNFGHNVTRIEQNGRRSIEFEIEVRPPSEESIQYWLTQNHRPIRKVLVDEGAAAIIKDEFGIEIRIKRSPSLSRPSNLGGIYKKLENRALSQGRSVVLFIDDEATKYEDLFYPLMEDYHVVRAPNAKAAFQQMDAYPVKLAIVDVQIGSGGIWSANETQDFKATGVKIVETILEEYPEVKIGVLTGTRHPLDGMPFESLAFFERKPIDPKDLASQVKAAMQQ